jgi:aldehyde dehydrogenase family 7 member A1
MMNQASRIAARTARRAASQQVARATNATARAQCHGIAAPARRHLSAAAASNVATTYAKYPWLNNLGIEETNNGVFTGSWSGGNGGVFTSVNPATNEPIAHVKVGDVSDYKSAIASMDAVKADWMSVPAPLRGEVVRQIGVGLRDNIGDLGKLVSLEMGKIEPEGVGEVQEAVDICDFAVGLSRQVGGSVLPSERPEHFMMERYNPLKGHVGIISAFNFPCAVYFWNLALSLVCGNTNLWKPSESVSLTAIACTRIVEEAVRKAGYPAEIATLVSGPGSDIGEALITDPKMELVSFTGSTKTGRHVNETIAGRFGKSILELGGNNCMIVMDDANMTLATRAAVFSAVGTAGQRCTTLRRAFVHSDVYDEFVQELAKIYKTIKIGNPLEAGVLCGPLHNKQAVENYRQGIEDIKAQGGKIIVGGNVLDDQPGNFVEPTIVEISPDAKCVQHELFAPILYVMKIDSLEHAIELNNDVPQGLSSSLFTTNQQSVFKWTGALGSDCGIVNVNIGPSGAEIGGAFGGEKETGAGGRESGSDAWKQYMRRSTCTINHGNDLPLAQGIKFE